MTEPDALAALFTEAGVASPMIAAESGTHPLGTPDDWWTIVLGTGFRGTLDRLSPDEADRVRRANLAAVTGEGITAVETNVVYAIARKRP